MTSICVFTFFNCQFVNADADLPNHTSIIPHSKISLDEKACIQQAQEKYDACIELAQQMMNNGPEHTQEFKKAHELIKGGCKKHLDTDLEHCKKAHKENDMSLQRKPIIQK